MGAYEQAYAASLSDREGFWLEAASAIDWTTPPTRGLDGSRAPLYRWFPDGELNTCHNALDRHVAAGAGLRTALIWDSAVTGQRRRYPTRKPSGSSRSRLRRQGRHAGPPRAQITKCRWMLRAGLFLGLRGPKVVIVLLHDRPCET